MKKYDIPHKIISKRTGVTSVVGFSMYPDEFAQFLNNDRYTCYVKCRRCNNSHDVNKDCECCDLETKISIKYTKECTVNKRGVS